jgi:hypothetical protein
MSRAGTVCFRAGPIDWNAAYMARDAGQVTHRELTVVGQRDADESLQPLLVRAEIAPAADAGHE